MVNIGYIFLKLDSTKPESGRRILRKLRKTRGIKEAYMIYGFYDIAVKIETETPEEFYDVLKKVKSYRGINPKISLRLTVVD